MAVISSRSLGRSLPVLKLWVVVNDNKTTRERANPLGIRLLMMAVRPLLLLVTTTTTTKGRTGLGTVCGPNVEIFSDDHEKKTAVHLPKPPTPTPPPVIMDLGLGISDGVFQSCQPRRRRRRRQNLVPRRIDTNGLRCCQGRYEGLDWTLDRFFVIIKTTIHQLLVVAVNSFIFYPLPFSRSSQTKHKTINDQNPDFHITRNDNKTKMASSTTSTHTIASATVISRGAPSVFYIVKLASSFLQGDRVVLGQIDLHGRCGRGNEVHGNTVTKGRWGQGVEERRSDWL